MVAVGDVQSRNPADRRDERVAAGAADAPDRVAHAVGRFEVEERRGGCLLLRDAVDLGRCAVREEHRSGLRAERHHMTRAVVFLVAPRALVLLDHVAVVLVE